VIIGRDPELTTVSRLLDGARHGEPGVLLVTGDPGMGKSTLLSQIAGEATDVTVLRSTPVETESEFPYAGLHELLLPAIGVLDSIPDVQAASLRGALALSDARGNAPLNIGAAVLSVLAVLSNQRTVVCVVDDAQWLDPPSLAAMQFAFRRLHSERVAVLVASDSSPDASSPWPRADTMVLTGLTYEDALDLIAAQVYDVVPAVVHALWSETEGNPGAMLEAVSMLDSSQRSGATPLPQPLMLHVGVPRWLSDQIDGLSAEGRRALLHASIAGTGTHRVIHRAELIDGMAEAEGAGLLSVQEGQVTIGHRMTAAQLLAVTDPQERRAAHLHIAESLTSERRHRELRLRHLAAAATGPDAALAAELADGAAELTATHGYGTAVGLLETAARLTTDPRLSVVYTVDAARAAWLAGQPMRADALLQQVAPELSASEDEPLKLAAAVTSVQVHRAMNCPHLPEWSIDPTAVPVLGVAWLMAQSLEAGPGRAALEFATQAQEVAMSSEPDLSWAAMLAVMRASDELLGLDAVREVIARGDLWDWSTLEAPAELVVEALHHLTTWSPLLARTWVESAIRRLAHLAHEHVLAAVPSASIAEGDAAFVRGRWSDALVAYNTGRSAAVETGQDRTVLRARARLEMVEVLRGRGPDAQTLVSLPPGIRAAITFAWDFANAKNTKALAEGSGIGWQAAASWLPPGSVSPADLSEVMARLGEHPAFPELERGSSLQRAWAAAFSGTETADALGRCLEQVDADAGFVPARLLGARGQHLLRQQHRKEAREQLRTAHDRFRVLGAVTWAEQIRRDLEATGVRVAAMSASGVEDLTPRELQIARCIAGGSTYKEVAAELFLGVKTVEFHVGNVYRKLGITSRRELGARLGELSGAS
jgi:DNA-binding CsgD family transcriptional regulator